MPRRAVDEMTVARLNKIVRDIEEGRARPALIRVGGVGGLGLNVRARAYASGDAISASWVLRRTFEGSRRDFALGAWPEIGLAQARERARGLMDKLWQGIDPTGEKKATRAQKAATTARSFKAAAQDYFNRQVRGKIGQRDEAKWANDLESFAYAFIGDLPVDRIETRHMMAIADQPHVRYGGKTETRLWESVPERASRCFKKIEAILAAETRLGHRSGDNPAAWKGHLSALLPAPSKVREPEHEPALPHEQLPAFMVALRARKPSSTSRALEFMILTAVRSQEVRGATWSEIDLERRIWTIPAARMKAKRDHRVALPEAAIALLKVTPRFAKTDLIWPGQKIVEPMCGETLGSLIDKMHEAEVKAGRPGWLDPVTKHIAVPHGFRTTLRNWAADHGYDRDRAELALSHVVGSAVERAYRRTDMLDRRREMLEDYATYALSAIGEGLRAVG